MQQGDESSFRQVYDLYHRKLYGFCYSFLKDHPQCEEVVQETFLNFWLYSKKLDKGKSLESLLFTIARRNLIDCWRKKIAIEKGKLQVAHVLPQSNNETEDHTLSKEYEHIYASAFQQLTEQQKTVFLLSREEGLSYQEIAERMHISKDTVKYHLTNALAIFRAHLSKHDVLYFFVVSTTF